MAPKEKCIGFRREIYAREFYPDSNQVSDEKYDTALNHRDSCGGCSTWYGPFTKRKSKIAPDTSRISAATLERKIKRRKAK